MHDIASVDDSTREFRTHNIDDLIYMVETQTDYVVSNQVKEMAEEITEWKANNRYGSSLLAAKEQIIKAIDLYHNEVQSLKQWTEEKHFP